MSINSSKMAVSWQPFLFFFFPLGKMCTFFYWIWFKHLGNKIESFMTEKSFRWLFQIENLKISLQLYRFFPCELAKTSTFQFEWNISHSVDKSNYHTAKKFQETVCMLVIKQWKMRQLSTELEHEIEIWVVLKRQHHLEN